MGLPQDRRCALWVSTATLQAAEELAELAGVGVDDFIEFVVKELHEHEAREGALRARAQEPGSAPVIPINEERRRHRQRPPG
jgi:hypothetical protein